jgi:hypothetical protein
VSAKVPISGEGGVWLSYYTDRSAIYAHANEAVVGGNPGGDSVVFVRWGESLAEAEERELREAQIEAPS